MCWFQFSIWCNQHILHQTENEKQTPNCKFEISNLCNRFDQSLISVSMLWSKWDWCRIQNWLQFSSFAITFTNSNLCWEMIQSFYDVSWPNQISRQISKRFKNIQTGTHYDRRHLSRARAAKQSLYLDGGSHSCFSVLFTFHFVGNASRSSNRHTLMTVVILSRA